MHPRHLLASLAVAAAAVVASPIDADIGARQTSNAVTLYVENFRIYSYEASYGGFETPLYTPPNVRYSAYLAVGSKYANCDQYQPAPPQLTDCPGKPAVIGFIRATCKPVDDEADGVYPLYNVTWSVTQYSKNFVVQYNIPDPVSGKTLVACDSYAKNQFICNSNSYYYMDPATYGTPKGITAKVGNVCPKS